MVGGYMSGSKRAKRTPSITNNICNLGGNKKGGLVTMQGRNANLYTSITNRGPYCCVETNLGCIAGLAYLKAKNLMTMNPQCSGGVPHRMYRGCRSGSGSGFGSGPVSGSGSDPILLRIASNTIGTNLWKLNDSDVTVAEESTFTVDQNVAFVVPTGTTLTIISTMIINGNVNIAGTLTLIGTIKIYGTINVSGIFNNNGNLENFSNNSLVNAGLFNHDGKLDNHGRIDNYSKIMMNKNINNYTGSNFTNMADIVISAGSKIVNSDSNRLTNKGTISSYEPNSVLGGLNNNGTVAVIQSNVGSSALESIADQTTPNIWTLKNTTHPIVIVDVLTIPTGQTLKVPPGLKLVNNARIQNSGIIENRGTIETYSPYFNDPGFGISDAGYINNAGGRIENYGTIVLSRDMITSPQDFISHGGIKDGTIINTVTGTITIKEGGRLHNGNELRNSGKIDNTSTIFSGLNATFQNSGTITNSPISRAGTMIGSELLVNTTDMHNIGIIENKSPCKITLNWSRFFNSGTVTNAGSIVLERGIFTNNPGSKFTNTGTVVKDQYSEFR